MAEAVTNNTFRLPLALSQQLDKRAQESGQTKTQIIVAALRAYLEQDQRA